MATVPSANLVGITGIARRLVLDGHLDEANAREALDTASREKRPVAGYLLEKKLVTSAALAAANSIEFGMPIFDVGALDPAQSAIKLVREELVRQHGALPMFKRGGRLFVGISDPTNTHALDELRESAEALDIRLREAWPRETPFERRAAPRLRLRSMASANLPKPTSG